MVITLDGHVVEIMLSNGNTHDVSVAQEMLSDVFCCTVLADCGYDSDRFRDALRAQNNDPHIPSRKNRKIKPQYDKDLYKKRKIIEIKFGNTKENKRIDTRFDKSDLVYLAFISMACIKNLLNIIIS